MMFTYTHMYVHVCLKGEVIVKIKVAILKRNINKNIIIYNNCNKFLIEILKKEW